MESYNLTGNVQSSVLALFPKCHSVIVSLTKEATLQ